MIFLRIEERVFERPLGFGSYCQLPHYCWPGTFVFGNCMWHVLHLTGLSVGVAGAGFGCDWHQHLAASTFVAFNYFFDMRMPPTWTHSPTMVYWIQASFLFLPTCWPYSFKPEKSVRPPTCCCNTQHTHWKFDIAPFVGPLFSLPFPTCSRWSVDP